MPGLRARGRSAVPLAHGVGADVLLLIGAGLGLVGGFSCWWGGAHSAAAGVWTAVTAAGVVMATGWIVAALRRRQAGVDVIAVLALAGALSVGEPLAGAVVTVMLASGRTLESFAARRARRELTGLLDRAPRRATRQEGEQWVDRPVDALVQGDVLLVRAGEVVPVDGRLQSPVAVLDESALTGEPMPVERVAGETVRSGVVNAGAPFEIRAVSTAAGSTYSGIVRLVEQAQASSAPFVRLANRYAAVFVPATLAVAGLSWAVSGSAVRAVAVLVIATPCPLILAAPVAIVAGLSRTARRGVIVKDGSALERLASGRTLLLDKTGTLTAGRPTLLDIVAAPEQDAQELLRLAASVDQASPHVLAAAIVRAARERGLTLLQPRAVEEVHGRGITGLADGHRVSLGKGSHVTSARPGWMQQARRRAAREDAITVFVGVDGRPAGVLLFDDPVRPDAAATLRALRRGGVDRIVLVTGDRQDIADGVGAALGIDQVFAERSPADKVDVVRLETQRAPTIMVGDGINDAPALASATVGAALAGAGATASSEAADVVLTLDRLDRLGEAVHIARRSRRIATQAVVTGMGLSFAGMLVAAAGGLAPVFGALAQEGIDVAVIGWALTALRPGRRAQVHLVGSDAALAQRFFAEHGPLRPRLAELRVLADTADTLPPTRVRERAVELHRFLLETLYPHELAEEQELYPVVARSIGGVDPTGPMSRAHAEIGHQIRRLGRLLADLGTADPDADDVRDLRRLLYELHATLRLHFAQEEESYFTLADEPAAAHAP